MEKVPKKYVSTNLQIFTFLDPQSYPGGKHKQKSKK